MKIQDININLMLDWANPPIVEVLVDRWPREEEGFELLFEEREGTYRAEHENGIVEFYHWVGPTNAGGFGGRRFPITMVDGTKRELLGPWSSNAESVNRVFFDRKPCIEITLMVDEGRTDFHGEKYYGRCAASMLIETLCVALDIEPMNYTQFMIYLLRTKQTALCQQDKYEHALRYDKEIADLLTTGSRWT